MRTKFNFSTASIKVEVPSVVLGTAQGQSCVKSVELPSIHIEGEIECGVSELRELWELQKEVLGDAPELLAKFVDSIKEKFPQPVREEKTSDTSKEEPKKEEPEVRNLEKQ